MATLISKATGNFTAAGTWGLCDSASENDSVAASTATTTSYVGSSNFTPGALTADGIALRLVSRSASPTGTFSVELYNSTGSLSVTSVTVNVSDIPATPGVGDIGWIFFKFGSSQLLLAATNYQVRVKSSTNAQVTVRSSATTNWSRQLRTTTTQAPASGDKLLVLGDWTAAATLASYVVTMENTATTSFGATTFPSSVAIGTGGTMTYGSSGSTAYYLRVAGIFVVQGGGTLNMGTVGTPIPSTSSAVLEFNGSANVDSGLIELDGCTVTRYGASETYDRAMLNADVGGSCNTSGTTVTKLEGPTFTGATGTIIINGVSYTISSVTNSTTIVLTSTAGTQTAVSWVFGSSTALTTDVSTGWKNGDTIAIAATGRGTSDTESTNLSADAVTTALTVSALTKGHMGTSPIQAEIIKLNRNVKVRGISASVCAFIDIKATANSISSWTEFSLLGSSTALKRGIDIGTTTGSVTFDRCSLYNYNTSLNSAGFFLNGATNNNITLTNNVGYNFGSYMMNNTATPNVITFTGNIGMKCNSHMFLLGDIGLTFQNNIAVGASSVGLYLNEVGGVLGTFSGNTSHSNLGTGFNLAGYGGTASSTIIWRNSNGIGTVGDVVNMIFDTMTIFGNLTRGMTLGGSFKNSILKSVVSNGGTGLVAQAYGIDASGQNIGTKLVDCTFGVTTSMLTADIVSTSAVDDLVFHNCLFSSSSLFFSVGALGDASFAMQKYQQTVNSHKTYMGRGVISVDTTIFSAGTPSSRMTPNTASFKLKSAVKSVCVNSGDTISISVKVRESVVGDGTDYNGSRIRLLVKANPAAGIASDTVLATATVSSEGAFETISGTSAAVTDNGALEFYVDCDGTTGWVNVEDWLTTTQNDGGTNKYWIDGKAQVSIAQLTKGLPASSSVC